MTILVAVRNTTGKSGIIKVGDVTTAEEARQAVFAHLKNVYVALALVP